MEIIYLFAPFTGVELNVLDIIVKYSKMIIAGADVFETLKTCCSSVTYCMYHRTHRQLIYELSRNTIARFVKIKYAANGNNLMATFISCPDLLTHKNGFTVLYKASFAL